MPERRCRSATDSRRVASFGLAAGKAGGRRGFPVWQGYVLVPATQPLPQLRQVAPTRALLGDLAGGPFVFNLGHGVLPETPLEGALIVADRILKVVNQTAFLFEEKTFSVTISAGVVTTQGEATITPVELLRRADEKLYQAKNDGRNRVCS